MKITVVTAARNNAATLAQTIESLLAQTHTDWEHIIVDGASTDNTAALVDSYRTRYDGRLKFISEPDGGSYDALNKGIAMATGAVVGTLNADDFYTSPDILATVAANIAGVDAVCADVHYVLPHNIQRCVRYYSSKHFRRWKMRFGYMPAHPTFYCHRELYAKLGNYDTQFRISADFDLLLRWIYLHHISLGYVAKDFVTMRTGGASTSGFKSYKQVFHEHLTSYRKNNVPSTALHECVRYLCKGTAVAAQAVWFALLHSLKR
jgi:glycosyltransferase involved in cell wall biosynthesis